MVLAYAKSILRLHDELSVAARFSGHRRPRRARHARPLCRLHAPLDPRVFKAFPRVQLELNCSLSTPLVGCVKRGEVDIALVTRMNDFTGGQVVRQEQLIWMTGEQSTAHRSRSPWRCCRRATSFATMRSNGWSPGLRWRIACVSPSVGGLQAAAFAGMAVTVLGRSALVRNMRELAPRRSAAAAEGRPSAL